MAGKLLSILSIAGSDNTGGAGIQADIRSGNSLGVHVMTAITTVTAQNSKGLKECFSLDPSLLESQLEEAMVDVRPDAIKIGMIGSVENLRVISSFLKSLPTGMPIVVDPVLYVSSDEISKLKSELDTLKLREGYLNDIFPLATVVTPNLYELKMFTGEIAASSLTVSKLNANAVVVKGGHSEKEVIEDILLIPGKKAILASHPKLKCGNLHGTGCVYSSILAAFLALGDNLETAFLKTSRQLQNIIEKSTNYQLGQSSYGPLNINENYYINDNILQ